MAGVLPAFMIEWGRSSVFIASAHARRTAAISGSLLTEHVPHFVSGNRRRGLSPVARLTRLAGGHHSCGPASELAAGPDDNRRTPQDAASMEIRDPSIT
jgi:hypothetical protein